MANIGHHLAYSTTSSARDSINLGSTTNQVTSCTSCTDCKTST